MYQIFPKKEGTIRQDGVFFETAKRLSEEGYPKPNLNFGQVWYFNGVEIKIHTIDEYGEMTHNYNGDVDFSAAIFAPNEDDIKNEMPDWVLEQIKEGWAFYLPSKPEIKYIHYKPYEACAAAWLAENEKKGSL